MDLELTKQTFNNLFGGKKKKKEREEIFQPQVFGVPFNREVNEVPRIIKRIVEYFETSKEGVEVEGLFRISGQLSEVNRMKAEFDEGNSKTNEKLEMAIEY